jgi:Recombination endonuclease VII/NUMOD3 motif
VAYCKSLGKMLAPRWHQSEEYRKRMSEARKGANNPNWKGGASTVGKRAYGQAWRKKNEDKVRDREYRKRFGISLAEYTDLWAKQGGVCAICQEPCKRGRLCVDHDHEDGRVRGLLCRICNIIIGQINDDFDWLERAREYLLAR